MLKEIEKENSPGSIWYSSVNGHGQFLQLTLFKVENEEVTVFYVNVGVTTSSHSAMLQDVTFQELKKIGVSPVFSLRDAYGFSHVTTHFSLPLLHLAATFLKFTTVIDIVSSAGRLIWNNDMVIDTREEHDFKSFTSLVDHSKLRRRKIDIDDVAIKFHSKETQNAFLSSLAKKSYDVEMFKLYHEVFSAYFSMGRSLWSRKNVFDQDALIQSSAEATTVISLSRQH